MGIPLEQRVIAVLFSLTLVLVTVQLIRKHRLREEYALAWLAASLGIFLLSVFDGLVGRLAAFFSVSYSPTLVLVGGLLFALTVLLSQSVIISNQANRMRDLTQSIALLEWRLRQLEGRNIPPTPRSEHTNGQPAALEKPLHPAGPEPHPAGSSLQENHVE